MSLSIVIPCYNCQKQIVPLLTSIRKSEGVNFRETEIIIVEDGSTDNSVQVISREIASKYRKFNRIKVIVLNKNSGPAAARNTGVKYARGKVVLFLDSDVVVYKKTIFEVIRSFKTDPDLYALTGVWDKRQKSNKFFPKFKALRDWSYWINERNPRHYYYLFSTRIAAINRQLFLRLGGFDTTYKTALVEDIELTYRIARRYAVVFNPKVIVHHEFENFLTVARKYFWRSYYWSRIYQERKKFDPVATTGKEALTTISAGLIGVFSILYLVFSIFDLYSLNRLFHYTRYYIQYTIYFFTFIHLWGVRKFLWFVAEEEGPAFALKALFTGLVLYWVILAGAFFSMIGLRKTRVQSAAAS